MRWPRRSLERPVSRSPKLSAPRYPNANNGWTNSVAEIARPGRKFVPSWTESTPCPSLAHPLITVICSTGTTAYRSDHRYFRPNVNLVRGTGLRGPRCDHIPCPDKTDERGDLPRASYRRVESPWRLWLRCKGRPFESFRHNAGTGVDTPSHRCASSLLRLRQRAPSRRA